MASQVPLRLTDRSFQEEVAPLYRFCNPAIGSGKKQRWPLLVFGEEKTGEGYRSFRKGGI
jgi:hypothetical protein